MVDRLRCAVKDKKLVHVITGHVMKTLVNDMRDMHRVFSEKLSPLLEEGGAGYPPPEASSADIKALLKFYEEKTKELDAFLSKSSRLFESLRLRLPSAVDAAPLSPEKVASKIASLTSISGGYCANAVCVSRSMSSSSVDDDEDDAYDEEEEDDDEAEEEDEDDNGDDHNGVFEDEEEEDEEEAELEDEDESADEVEDDEDEEDVDEDEVGEEEEDEIEEEDDESGDDDIVNDDEGDNDDNDSEEDEEEDEDEDEGEQDEDEEEDEEDDDQ